MRHSSLLLAAAALSVSGLPAQINVVSAKAGLIHYTEGQVALDGKEVDAAKPGKFADMKNGSELRTGEGRAEVLLASPSFVRLAENSAIRMLSNSLAETRLEVTAGSALIEAAEVAKNTAITVVAGGSTIMIEKSGIYRVDLTPTPELKVYDGEATITNSGKSTVLKAGRAAGLATGGEFVMAKFDNKATDELYRWSKRRSGYVSMANVAAANSVYTNGYSMAQGSWLWNPYFGMYTAVPMRGFWRSPFGYRYYNPQMAYNYVSAPVSSGYASGRSYDSTYGSYGSTGSMGPTYNSNYGYSTVDSRSSGGYSGGYSGSSSPAAAAPAASSGGDGGSRGAGGGAISGGQSGGGGGRGGGGN